MTAAPLSFEELFDPDLLARTGALALRVAAAQKGGRLADQRTSARGQGSDFADFKPYVAGDDLRMIDWNIYRRLGKAFVRVFEERQDLPLYLMVDVSGSMLAEAPPRLHAAMRAALALAAIALEHHDSVTLLPFAQEVSTPLRAVSGRAAIARVARALADSPVGGATRLAEAVEQVTRRGLRRGLLVVVSDFFDARGLDAVIAALTRVPHRMLLVQMTMAHDGDPALSGDVMIEDGEGGTIDLTATPALVERYREAYRAFCARLTGLADSRGAGLLRIDAQHDVLDQIAPWLLTQRVTL